MVGIESESLQEQPVLLTVETSLEPVIVLKQNNEGGRCFMVSTLKMVMEAEEKDTRKYLSNMITYTTYKLFKLNFILVK